MEKLMHEYSDLFVKQAKGLVNNDDEAIKKSIEEDTDKFLAMIEPRLAKNKFLGGDKLVVADFWIGSMYCDKATNPHTEYQMSKRCWATLLKKYPNFVRYGEDFKKQNANWLANRPACKA